MWSALLRPNCVKASVSTKELNINVRIKWKFARATKSGSYAFALYKTNKLLQSVPMYYYLICSTVGVPLRYHEYDDVIKWKHFPRYWPFVRGIHRSPVKSPHKGQWRGVLALCEGNSPVPGEIPSQRPVTRSFDVFFDLRLNKRLSKTIVRLMNWDAIALIMTSV